MDINERIKVVRMVKELSQSAFGEVIGLTKSSISNIEKGIRNVTEQHIRLVTNSFNVNEEWLRSGEGEMFNDVESFSLDEKAEKYNLTDLEIEIMKNYMELDQSVRKGIIDMLKKSFNEVAASTADDDFQIDREVENYRQELEAAKKAQKSSASGTQNGRETS